MNEGMLRPNQVLIDRYRVERYLNAGGMQEVYLCEDLKLGRWVVAKTPKGGVVDKRFRRGAEMSARINHHNIAATFDYYEGSEATFMIEEYVDGFDLQRRLSTEFQCLDPALAAHVIHNVARALHEAHSRNICHRDLKPSNIMTSSDPGMASLKLTDFGIAKLAENEIAAEMSEFERDETTLTNSNTLLGAVPYMAPEAWTNWRGAGQPLDVWALGCIAYQLISGVLPFGSGRAAIMAVARLESTKLVELPAPTLFGRSPYTARLEDELLDFINRCLQFDPRARPSAAQLLALCGSWCYGVANRRRGTVSSYGERYAFGGKSKTGYISEDGSEARYFYHRSEYYSASDPIVGAKVCLGAYAGEPYPRAAPVLPLK